MDVADSFYRRVLRGLFLVSFALLSINARAGDEQIWTAVAINGPVQQDSRWLAWFDGHARFRDQGSDLDVSIIRPAIGWRLNSRVDLWAGYAWVNTERPGRDVHEERLWQQATYGLGNFAGGKLSGRTRLEQRERSSGSDTGWRLRQMLRYGRPLPESPWGLVVSTELFAGLNEADWGQRSGFDQGRTFFGASRALSPKARVEFGYLNQHIRIAGSPPDRTNHNLSVAFFATL